MATDFKKYLAEFIATFALVFIGAGSILANDFTSNGIGIVGIALAHGLILMTMVYATGHISGGHVNPAVTISLWAAKKISTKLGFFYLISQLLGASLAGFMLKIIFSNSPKALYLGAPIIAAGIPMIGAILIEAVLTFFLVFVVFGTAVDQKAPKGMYGLAIGMTLAGAIFLGGPLTGAALNPAVAFGPSLAANYWVNHSVYWIGPVIGGIIAALLYNYLILKKK